MDFRKARPAPCSLPAFSQASASELGNFFQIKWPMRPSYCVDTEKEGAPLESLSPLPRLFYRANQTTRHQRAFPFAQVPTIAQRGLAFIFL